MKRALVLLLFALAATGAFAQPTKIDPGVDDGGGGGGGASAPSPTQYNLTDRHGPKMAYAKVVYIFWGTLPSNYASELQAYRDISGGMKDHMGMLDQYNAWQASLTSSQADVFDASEPPFEVTDELIRAKVAQHFAGRYDNNAVYVVYIGDGHYATYRDGTTSCGGPPDTLGLCAWHQSYHDAAANIDVKYAIVPFASCGPCRVTSTSGLVAGDVQNAMVFTIHEVREAMTDPVFGTGWLDQPGYEADDKCSWAVNHANVFSIRFPAGPNDTPYWHPGHDFFFQKEWSNAVHGCVN